MDIRDATKEDATQIKQLVIGLSHLYLANTADLVPARFLATLELKEFEKRIKEDQFTNLVCKTNEKIIGFISVKDKNHIYHLFVSQQHQRKGFAKKLWKAATALCGATRYTVRSSLYAVPVYESFGFIKSADAEAKDSIEFQKMELNIQR